MTIFYTFYVISVLSGITIFLLCYESSVERSIKNLEEENPDLDKDLISKTVKRVIAAIFIFITFVPIVNIFSLALIFFISVKK